MGSEGPKQQCSDCMFESVMNQVNQSLLNGHSYIYKHYQPVASNCNTSPSRFILKRERGELRDSFRLGYDDVIKRMKIERLGFYRVAWRGEKNSQRWNFENRSRVTAINFFGGAVNRVGHDKVCVVSGSYFGEIRAIVFDECDLKGNFNDDRKNYKSQRGGMIKPRSFTLNDWAFAKRVNGLAVDWKRGGLVGCSDRREIKILRVLGDGHIVVDRDLGSVGKFGRCSPTPKCLTYSVGDGRIIVGDDKGRILLFDPRSDESPSPTLFAHDEDINYSAKVADVSTCVGSEHLLVVSYRRGPVQLFDLRKPYSCFLEHFSTTSTAKLNDSGTRIASLSQRDNYVRVWQVRGSNLNVEAKIKHCFNTGYMSQMKPFLGAIRPVWITDDLFMMARYDGCFHPSKFQFHEDTEARGRCYPIAIYDVKKNRQVASLMSPRVNKVSFALAMHPTKECLVSATLDETLWIPDYSCCGHNTRNSKDGILDGFRKGLVIDMLAGHEGLVVEERKGPRKRRKTEKVN